MIELPCKGRRVCKLITVWDVYYRDYEDYGLISHKTFYTEPAADAFMQDWIVKHGKMA